MTSPDNSSMIAVGKIGRSYGVRGAFHLWSYTEPLTNILNYLPLTFCDDDKNTFEIKKAQIMGKKIIAQCDAFNNPESIKTIVNKTVYAPRDRLPKLKKGEHYWFDLEELIVKDQQGETLGSIDHIMDTPANPVIVIKTTSGSKLLLPYIDSVVKTIDIKKHCMQVEWHGYTEEEE